MGSPWLLTVITLHVLDLKLHNETLLKCGIVLHLFMNGEFDLYPTRVLLSVDEGWLYDLHLLQPFHFWYAECHEFIGFKLTSLPWRSMISLTLSAWEYSQLLWDTLSYIYLSLQALYTCIWCIWVHGQTTLTASPKQTQRVRIYNAYTFTLVSKSVVLMDVSSAVYI